MHVDMYNALAQAEREAQADGSDSNASRSPSPPPHRTPYREIPTSIENLGNSHSLEPAEVASAKNSRLSSRSHSPSSIANSYDMLGADDYEPERYVEYDGRDGAIHNPAPLRPSKHSQATADSANASHPGSRSSSPRPIVRTASHDYPIPLRHPTPDLQMLQGAYVGNVEKLEASAERLSMTSDIGEEIRKISLELKRSDSRRFNDRESEMIQDDYMSGPAVSRKFSSSSISNSIIRVNSAARAGGYSPCGYITSPTGSIRSGSWSQPSGRYRSTSKPVRLPHLPEPEQEGRPLDSPSTISSSRSTIFPPPPIDRKPSLSVNGEDSLGRQVGMETSIAESPEEEEKEHQLLDIDNAALPRRASVDTYRQAAALFTDFDGTHYSPSIHDVQESEFAQSLGRQFSLHREPLAENAMPLDRPHAVQQSAPLPPPPEQGGVFYPAPVPMMLNLPQRLSKLPTNPHSERRRSNFLGTLSNETRKSAVWLPGVEDGHGQAEEGQPQRQAKAGNRHSRATFVGLPPQLRASAFFDRPALQHEVQVKGGSAMATLDEILEASVNAPVDAFLDHPFAGRLGTEVYGPASDKRRSKATQIEQIELSRTRSALNLVRSRDTSSTALDHSIRTSMKTDLTTLPDIKYSTGTYLGEIEAESANVVDEESAVRVTSIDGDVEPMSLGDGDQDGEFADVGEMSEQEGRQFGQPTTLLAELQLRKEAQKQRNRTAAKSFPNGMHSTLLELDAVAQMEKNTRGQKHVKLAWEDPDAHHPQDKAEDDDVPLGVLFPKGLTGQDRPMGLLEKRQMEDNEPLSRRRARLRGEPIGRTPSPMKSVSVINAGVSTQEEFRDSEDEGETLAERLKRLKAEKGTSAGLNDSQPTSEFATDLLSQLGDLSNVNSPVGTPAAEETLGQRRKRLQAEREARSRQVSAVKAQTALDSVQVKKRRSMADILQERPLPSGRKPSEERRPATMAAHGPQRPQYGLRQTTVPNIPSIAGRFPPHQPLRPGLPNTFRYSANTLPNEMMFQGQMMQGMMPYSNPYATGSAMTLQMGHAPISLEPKQREVINRWRQSVHY